MSIKNKKFLAKANEWAESGQLPSIGGTGLCSNVPGNYKKSLLVFKPDDTEMLVFSGKSAGWWASDVDSNHPDKERGFKDLRKTITAFLLVFGSSFYTEFVSYKITSADGTISFTCDEDFLDYVKTVYKKYEKHNPYPSEIHWLPENIQQAKEYIHEYCNDLTLEEL